MPQIAKVAVAAATYAIDKPYDYLIPQGTDIAVGMRVLAPFGRGNRVSEGGVLARGQGVPDKPIKPIRSVVDREPVITDREIRLALWMRERYFCTFYDAIRTILPAAVWYSYREMWSLTGEPLPEDLSEREAAACRLLQDGPMERDARRAGAVGPEKAGTAADGAPGLPEGPGPGGADRLPGSGAGGGPEADGAEEKIRRPAV